MDKHFTHLHLHTDYSLLDGAIGINQLVDFGKKNNFKSLAISDHGNVFGAVRFFQACKAAGIKPILGMESYFTTEAHVKNAQNRYYHLLLIVENEIGYRNLCKLISYSYQEGFYFKPRIDYRMLEKHSEGLIATSSCLGGHIPKLLMSDQEKEALERIEWFRSVFGPDRFYLEVQPEDQTEQATLNQKLYAISKEHGIPLVATADCHYVSQEDRHAHEVMLAVQTHDKISNPNRYTFGDCRVHMRNTQEMLELFKDHEDAVWNAGKIADRCSFDFPTGKLFFPHFEVPKEYSQETFFSHLCHTGLDELFDKGLIKNEKRAQYVDRLELEIALIIKMGFVGYFLVVSDFIQWAYRNDVPVGPGRGSAAGSLVAWALKITNIDPLEYNLLFERFLNPERVSMPDIDIDFCIEGRERVIEYIRQKYGKENVCHIITFGTMLAKGVIKDVARALGFPFEDSNSITSLIPDQLKITLQEAIAQEPRLKELIEQNPKAKQLFDIALKLEGKTRHASKHAAGIVISPEPIDQVLPVYVPPDTDELVAQYAMSELESIGFLKIDLLGLKNLTLIDRVVKLVKELYGVSLDMNRLPLDDEKTFQLVCAGNTSGVFQLESSGLKEVLRKLLPSKFEDIIAVNALYRPGPLGSGMVDDFIERRHGRQAIPYVFKELEAILAETYGVIVYQEQVIKIASVIGGYSLGEADILRRAMGKKKASVMAEQQGIFVQRSTDRGFNAQKAGELFDLMAYFAGYGFNKSHSAAYALIAYQTAYLKAHYPEIFMAQLISLEASHPEKMSFYLQEAKDMGIRIVPPTINKSLVNFAVLDKQTILFSFSGIKNVGHTAIESIIAERTKSPFLDLLDFCKRVDLRTVNKRVIEQLIFAGAFDALPGNRAQKVHELEQVMQLASQDKRNKLTGQMGIFGGESSLEDDAQGYVFALKDELTTAEKLEREKEAVGFYLSAHPMESYKKQMDRFAIRTIGEYAKTTDQVHHDDAEPIALICGMIKSKKEITTKKGDKMAFLQVEDATGAAEVIVFPKTYLKFVPFLEGHTVFVVKGEIDRDSSATKIKAHTIIPLSLVMHEWPTGIPHATITFAGQLTEDRVQHVLRILRKGKTSVSFSFIEDNKRFQLNCRQRFLIDEPSLQELESLDITVQCIL